ncbi:MAG: alanine--tRNA ligase [Candidatus Bipolaricaulota bacterium]|nr:MAG: alanine--tRNA ligase [Candidatus Bipolaricaulota bacterium]
MRAAELRTRYLRFFAERGHEQVPSSSLVPDDPTLLFTSAGMVQFKDAFWGRAKPSFSKAVSAQKCFRTTDIESVGKTAFHHTFFEMLGNFSFGDYFKEGAIRLAWEFVIDELGLPPDRIWVSVYEDDDEAFTLWTDLIGIPEDRIQRLGKEHNWWGPVGDRGPCGPDSELFYDLGEEHSCGSTCDLLGCDCDRFSEIWNLVFLQYDAQPDGRLTPLEQSNVDTGMGLERTAAVLQGVTSDYACDVFTPLVEAVEALAGGPLPEALHPERHVVADHVRGVVALVADGVLPSNERQGYVLRRILRRAVRAGQRLGVPENRLASLVDPVVASLGEAYPEMAAARALAERVISQEEASFRRTLRAGEIRLDEVLGRLRDEGAHEIPGDVAFELYDTYGFPVEMTVEIASEHGLGVDRKGFEEGMSAQRERSRTKASASEEGEALPTLEGAATSFVGYETLDAEATLVRILENGSLRGLVFDSSPFYAASGGQLSDTGVVSNQSRDGEGTVHDALRTAGGIILHRVAVERGVFEEGDRCLLRVDPERRRRIERNHTATHLLHRALRDILGDHVAQAGSQVAPDELRFDFTHYEPLTPEQLGAVEDLVNRVALSDEPVRTEEMALEAAVRSGAVAQFTDEYRGKDSVRVVSVGDFSRELCAGTHVRRSGEIGLMRITAEEGIAAGTRRIRAITGDAVVRRMRSDDALLAQIRARVGDDPVDGLRRIDEELAGLRAIERAAGEEAVEARAKELQAEAESVKGVALHVSRVDGLTVDRLKELADRIVAAQEPCVAALFAETEGRAVVVVKRSPEVDAVDAGAVVRAAAAALGGGGGGSAQFAQGGGPNASDIDAALLEVRESLRAALD